MKILYLCSYKCIMETHTHTLTHSKMFIMVPCSFQLTGSLQFLSDWEMCSSHPTDVWVGHVTHSGQ